MDSTSALNSESFTPSVQTAPETTNRAHGDFSEGEVSKNGASNTSLPNKGKNSIRSHFSSLRRSAKRLFKHRSKSEEYERGSRDGAPKTSRATSDTFRARTSAEPANQSQDPNKPTSSTNFPTSKNREAPKTSRATSDTFRARTSAELPSQFQESYKPTSSTNFPDSKTREIPLNNLQAHDPTRAMRPDSPQVDPGLPPHVPNLLPSSEVVGSTARYAPLMPGDPLLHTEIIHGAPPMVVFTPPASPATLRAPYPPAAIRAPSMTSSHPPSSPPTPPPTPPPATKTNHAEFHLEAALKDMASQAVTFPPPADRSPYLDGAVISLKCLVFAVASIGVCAAALPGTCLGLIGVPSEEKSVSQDQVIDCNRDSGPDETLGETHGEKSDLKKNTS